MRLMRAPAPWVYMDSTLWPVPWSSRSSIIWPKSPIEQPMTMCRYWLPICTISSTSVWLRKKRSDRLRPSTAHSKKPTKARNRPFTATVSARFCCLAPKARPMRALTPTAVPADREIIRFWAGNARDTAVSDASLTQETNTLSTMLYRACTSMEAMMGRDISQMSFFMGITPSLFSFCIVYLLLVFRPRQYSTFFMERKPPKKPKSVGFFGESVYLHAHYAQKSSSSSRVQLTLPWAKPSRPPPRPWRAAFIRLIRSEISCPA